VCTWLVLKYNIIISLSTLSCTLEQAGLIHKILQKLAAEHDNIHWQEFQASLHDNFIGDGSEFVVLTKPARISTPIHNIMVRRQEDSEHN
jgi:hypothetical protein